MKRKKNIFVIVLNKENINKGEKMWNFVKNRGYLVILEGFKFNEIEKDLGLFWKKG